MLKKVGLIAAFAWLTGLPACVASPDEVSDSTSWDQVGQDGLKGTNGLKAVNGLKGTNGLSLNSSNGLNATNGLSVGNGLTSVNGLVAVQPLLWQKVVALSPDCTNRTPGVDCTGLPDGILSASTGLSATPAGAELAKYLVKCALGPRDAITIYQKDLKGTVLRKLYGSVGLAPEWKTGTCDQKCQEDISACLMAHTNGQGENVDFEISHQELPQSFVLNPDGTRAFPAQEGVFFGNLFPSPPQAYWCVGKEFEKVDALGTPYYMTEYYFDSRLCDEENVDCPFERVGFCDRYAVEHWSEINASATQLNYSTLKPPAPGCSMTNGVATSCTDDKGNTWSRPVTSHVGSVPQVWTTQYY